jgi:hypothetical protein
MQPTYLIPFDKHYFLLGLSLLTSLKRYVSNLQNIYVLDFGLEAAQVAFLKEYGICVAPLPEALIGLDPFALKANLNTFLRSQDLLGRWLVLLDADMLILKSPIQAIESVMAQMQQEGQQLALCQDMGPATSVAQFIDLFRFRNTQFTQYTAPFDLSVPYLNIGFVIFSPEFDFDQYREAAYSMPKEICWVQNAMNLMCLQGTPYLLLDPQQWNLHGRRSLDAFSEKDHPYVLHITSDGDNLVQKSIDLTIGNHQFTFPYRFTNNPVIDKIQAQVLDTVTKENSALFLKYLQ